MWRDRGYVPGGMDGRARARRSSQRCATSAPGAGTDTSPRHADLPRRDYNMDPPSGVSDHGACCDWRRGAGNEPHHHHSRVAAVWNPQRTAGRAGCCEIGRRRAPRNGMSARSAIVEARLDAARTRMAEYLELTKPRVTAMVLITTLAGYYLGAAGAFESIVALNLLIGTAFASGGTLALNQYMERDTDAIMNRTCHRPIPDKRIGAIEAFWFGTIATLAGLGYLMLTVNWLSAAVTAAIAITYLFAYTPLK